MGILVNIPATSLWGGAGMLVSGTFLWLLRLDRKSRSFLTADKHEEICLHRDVKMNQRFDELRDILEDDRRESRHHREQISADIQAQGVKIAVIQNEIIHLNKNTAINGN